jgi:ATP-dependent DNA helicase RecQ
LFLKALAERHSNPVRASELPGLLLPSRRNPWLGFLQRAIEAWRYESDNAELPAAEAREFFHEFCAESRRDFSCGEGVTLGTVHAAKGTEFDHVLLIGPWPAQRSRKAQEEERRAFYVGMTRARQTLAVIDAQDVRSSLAFELEGPSIVRRNFRSSASEPEFVALDYTLLGLDDINLGYPALFDPSHPIHGTLSSLQPGDRLAMQKSRNGIYLYDSKGLCVSRLSHKGETAWRDALPDVREVRVVAVVRRHADQDDDVERRTRCRVSEWEVPVVEVVSQAPDRRNR